jgi:hypothetical protein
MKAVVKLSLAQRRLALPVIRAMNLRDSLTLELSPQQLEEFTEAVFRLPHSDTRTFRTWDALTNQVVRLRREGSKS